MTAPGQHEHIEETSVGDIIGNISNDLSQLFRQEIELAKAELRQEAGKTGKAAGMLGGAITAELTGPSALLATGVGLAAAVVGGGLATVLTSAITGNSLS